MILKGEPMAKNHKKPKKAAPVAKGPDKRQALKWLQVSARSVEKNAERLREEILAEGSKRDLPKPGSKWRKHPAFAEKYSTFTELHVYEYVCLAWAEKFTGHGQAVVLRTDSMTMEPYNSGPYTLVAMLDVFLVEWVPV